MIHNENSLSIVVFCNSDSYLHDVSHYPQEKSCKQSNLVRFTLRSNSLGLGQPTDLDFVSCLANATFLNFLLIGKNNFGGIFPSVICNFTRLSRLDLETNKIAGQIPSCIHNLVGLQGLYLLGNKLSGVIPSGAGKLQNLLYLDISANQLSGRIPSSIGNLTHLTRVILSENNLEGHIPSTLGNLLGIALSCSAELPQERLQMSEVAAKLSSIKNKLRGIRSLQQRQILAGL
ncbi:hypothetical protein Cgig2_032488 [Carnegiea gigantea]|uniref:Uncharacterized protein n=1 Tax=Carnegiea gigantea TaxID=171969 RepID=A0A9Q1KWK3_9CARY|nr:hypothetical protein Cgig2_032488 [Carnegiea gigantea]